MHHTTTTTTRPLQDPDDPVATIEGGFLVVPLARISNALGSIFLDNFRVFETGDVRCLSRSVG